MSKADDTRVKQIRDTFALWYEADKPQRDREEMPLRMYALDQWEDTILDSRKAQPANGIIPATPARPCLVLDMLREPVHQIVNQERESDLAVEVIPADDFGSLEQPVDPAEIELREGLIRRAQRESNAASARSWAFLRAAICGRGYYAINTRYVDGKTFDQEIYYRRILNQGSVLLDPIHEEPDGSDSSGGFIFSDLSFDAYKAEYPRAANGPNKYVNCSDSEWAGLMDEAPGWFTQDGDKKYVRVAEYWHTEYNTRELILFSDGSTAWKDELPKGERTRGQDGKWKSGDPYDPQGREITDTRSVVEKSIKWCKTDGCQILDETDWPSPYVPIIKIVGNEIPPHKSERRVDGLINKSAIESQRGRNYMASRIAEEFGLATPTPLMVAEGTIEGYEAFYAQSATRAFVALPYKQTDLEGRPAPPPFRPDKNVNVGQMAQGMQIFMESVQTSTNVTNPQMGKPSRHSETWRGTQVLINQGERGTSNFMDNLQRSLSYDGKILNSLLRPIFGRPGRMVKIVKGEDDIESVPVGTPFMMQDDGQGQQRPVPAPPGATPQQEGVRQYVLTEKGDSASVAVKVTKGYDTRRQEESAVLGEMVTQQPQMMTVIGDLFFGSQDWPGAKEAKERFKVMLDPKVQAMLQQQEGGQNPIPPMALQQMQQMQAQLQQVTQAAQQMQQDLQSKATETQLKMQGEERIAQIKAEAEIRLAEIKMAQALEEARIKAGTAVQTQQQKDDAALVRSGMEHQHALQELVMEANLQPEPEPAQEQV